MCCCMQASECDEHCNWSDRDVFFGTAQDVEFTAEFEQLEDWIADGEGTAFLMLAILHTVLVP